MFRAFCHKNHKSWSTILPKIEELYNNTYHDSTGFTPCEVLYGKTNTMTFDKFLPQYTKTLNSEQIRQCVRENLIKASKIRQTKFILRCII